MTDLRREKARESHRLTFRHFPVENRQFYNFQPPYSHSIHPYFPFPPPYPHLLPPYPHFPPPYPHLPPPYPPPLLVLFLHPLHLRFFFLHPVVVLLSLHFHSQNVSRFLHSDLRNLFNKIQNSIIGHTGYFIKKIENIISIEVQPYLWQSYYSHRQLL